MKTSEHVLPAGADAALTQAVDALIEFGGLMLRTGTEAFRVRQRMGEIARALGIDALALHVLLGSIEVTVRRGDAHVTLVGEIGPLGIDARRLGDLERLARGAQPGLNDKRMNKHALAFMRQALGAAGVGEIWEQHNDTCHLNGTARMGANPSSSVVDADCRSWDIRNLWICDGSVFPTVGGVNPSLTIQAIACRTADRIKQLARRGELKPAGRASRGRVLQWQD